MILRNRLLMPVVSDGDHGDGAGTSKSTSSATSDDGVDDDQDEKPKFVSREAYERLQRDLVKFKGRFREADSKLNEFESDKKAREEAKLLEEKKFQEIIEQKELKIKELMGTVDNYQIRDQQAKKYTALTSAIGKKIPDKYLPVIPLDEIQIVDGEIDSDQVKEVAGRFLSTYPEIFKTVSSDMPGDFPKGKAKKMSLDEFKAQGRVKGSRWMREQRNAGNVDFS